MDKNANLLTKGEKNTVVKVDNLTVRFNVASEKIDNLKEYFIKVLKRELMFKEFFALKDISFEVKEGEAWGLIGTNGSGKSTLLKVIAGILKPYKGKVTISGSIAPLIELGAGFDPELTARENIFLNGAVLGHDHEFMEEHFNEIVDFAELHNFLDMPIKNYSSGMAARLGFAIATMVKTDILICDEVLSVGDYAFQQKCEERMRSMLDNGTTLLYVSHDTASVRRLCDHAIWLDKGKEVMQGNALTVCNEYIKELQGDIQAAKEGDNFDYVVIQTDDSHVKLKDENNVPVELFSKNGLPTIFYFLRRYPDKKFIIIGNKNLDVVERYISAFGGVQYIVLKSKSDSQNAQIAEALEYIPDDKRILITNYNIVLNYKIRPEDTKGNIIGTTDMVEREWIFLNQTLKKQKGKNPAAADFFIFEDKKVLEDIPNSGDFFEYLHKTNIKFEELKLGESKIIETKEDLADEHESDFPCRSFDIIKDIKGVITKLPQDDLGRLLSAQEANWYKKIISLNYAHIPPIYDYNPISMKKIEGRVLSNIDTKSTDRKEILDKIVRNLEELHALKGKKKNIYSLKDVYFGSTFSSLNAIQNIVPFAGETWININGKQCRNPFSMRQEIADLVQEYLILTCKDFRIIHGDCTFSNIILSDKGDIVFIDPQGAFGQTEYYGDADYDWSKLYMSVFGNWDNFLEGKYRLEYSSNKVEIEFQTLGWKDLEEYYLSRFSKEQKDRIRLIHALTWLSATMYKWYDYNGMCAAFYTGTFYLNIIMDELGRL